MNIFANRLIRPGMMILLCAAMLLLSLGCQSEHDGGGEAVTPAHAETPGSDAINAGNGDNNGGTPEETVIIADNVPDFNFGGADFVIGGIENPNFSTVHVVEELTGELMNDAIYARTIYIEERFNVNLVEFFVWDSYAPGRWTREVNAGDFTFHMYTMRIDHALPFWLNGTMIPWDAIPYIDLEQPWWNQSINEFLTINDAQPMVIGAFNISTYDLAFALLFNQQIVADLNLPVPYGLVRDGTWTMDAMLGMMREFTQDVTGDGTMGENDHFGYVAHPKMVVPNFTIGAGEFMIRKDAQDLPYLAMTGERFLRAWERVYEMMWDGGHWWSNMPLDADVPSAGINMFQEGRALFMDTSFFEIERLRAMETDFGILPYPKLDTYQERFYARISYYVPTIVPITNTQLEKTGALFEALNAKSYRTVLPTYLDTILMVRNIRDEESAEMLDLMFNSFVVDIGDTSMCVIIRDSFVAQMFSANDRRFVSTLERNERRIQRELDRMIERALEH